MNNSAENSTSNGSMLKFIVMSAIGIFLFMTPIPGGDGTFNIPLGYIINWLNGIFGHVVFGEYAQGDFQLHYMAVLICVTVSIVLTIAAYTVKPKFIMDSPKLKPLFLCSPVYLVTRLIAALVAWMIFLGIGPDFVINAFTGDIIIGLAAGLFTIFLILAPTMPIITDFGLMEFIGILIRKVVRFLFTLPGRASVDLMASWFGSSVASVIITRGQHERGFYTAREASVIAVNFSFVSLPFTFVIASTLGLQEHFLPFYLIMSFACIVLAVIMPRIWPLRSIPDDYLAEVGKQIDEDVPENTSTSKYALSLAKRKANQTKASDIVKAGLDNYVGIFMDLIPTVLAWGTLALIVVEMTPLFDFISWPMGAYLNVLGVESAFEVAPTTLLGFVDMFLPALMVGDVAVRTQFIIGVLSVVQIIYLAETGVLILKSKMPLNIGKLFIIFMMRTIISLPIIVLLTSLFMNF